MCAIRQHIASRILLWLSNSIPNIFATSFVHFLPLSTNVTLLITGAFAVAAGGSPNYIVLSALAAAWSLGVGGTLPVDSAIFLEFVPPTHQYLLTILSIWWEFGQLIESLVGSQPLGLARLSGLSCLRLSNQGWRYFLFTMGGLMLVLWAILFFFLFMLYESPKYLMGKDQDEESVEVLHKVASYNGAISTLTLAELQSLGDERDLERRPVSTTQIIAPLFATRAVACSTSLLIALWALIGLVFPLLETQGTDFGDGYVYITYRNQVILSAIGVPGTLLGGYMVELPYLGRRGTVAVSIVLTGVFILASTTARTSNVLLGWNCAYGFMSNVMYGALYAITPELFPTKNCGTGNAMTATANRIFGVMVNLRTPAPIFIAGAIFLISGCLAVFLPYEMRGKASL
ncbi:major facilitator superfamily domain-containing protein [Flammula alnicola]|nr:major facilitator superfamily domain-containing protein [Flammula alnicola]